MASNIKMKANAQMKVRGGHTKFNTQQMIFELKHRVVIALNKVADRDTYQIGVDELEKTVEHLTPDMIPSFLSCISDTDSEQKSVVRKECIRLMGTLARFHEGLIGPYLAKMVSSIVKRLKDPDSIVRDTCVETMGVLASQLSSYEDHNYGVFVALVKPLFEALGEQNKHMQSGSALCLARIIDSTPDPPGPILQRMLTRTVKLLNNSHFMAKPAVIELNRSIIQAGGATTKNGLFAAMAGFQVALKNTDWTTRKSASVALCAIASSGRSFLESLKTSCIRSLESCRFDRVKPVRDSVLVALQYWRNIPGSDAPEPSEAESSFKGSFCGADECNEVTSTGDSGWKDAPFKKPVMELAKKKLPLASRKASKNYAEDPPQSKQGDWRIEIAAPKSKNVSMVDSRNEESEGSCLTKMFERKMGNVLSMQEVTHEYVPMDDKPECSSVTNHVNDEDDTKSITVSPNTLQAGGLLNPGVRNRQFGAEEMDSEEQPYLNKMRDRRSLDSTVTVSSSQANLDCCSQMVNDMASLHKQLSEIENKQSSIMNNLQAFSTGIMNSLSILQSKVLGLEYVVDGIAKNLVQDRNYSDSSNSSAMKHNQSILSPRLSTCTPRPSMDIRNRKPSLLTTRNLERNTRGASRLNDSPKQSVEMWANPGAKTGPNHTEKDIWNSSSLAAQTMNQMRKNIPSDLNPITGQIYLDERNGLRKHVKSALCDSELDLEYVGVLSSGDELALVELLDRTGPVLDSLSPATINELLSVIVSYIVERRFMNSIIPWLHQVVELSTIHGPNYLVPSPKTRCEILSAIQEALTMECSSLAERRSVNQLSAKLRQVWGK